jgi:tetratricopeptide (TPR) repeat protein
MIIVLAGSLAIGTTACKQKSKPTAAVVSGDYEKGEAYLFKKNDSAFYYFNKSISNSKDSLEIAMAYSGMAIIQSDAGDYFGSQESLLGALKYLNESKEEDHYCLLSAYNELGNTSFKLKNYAAANTYFDQTLKFIKDDGFRIIALNNKATALQKNMDFDQSIAIYNSILKTPPKDKKELARITSNLARSKWLQDSSYQAAPELLMALRLRTEEKDNWGLNASYSHLSDYYSANQPDSALVYANKMYDVARDLGSADDQLEALQKLIRLSAADQSKKYFTRYEILSDSVQVARNAAKNQFAVVRYGLEKSKADNLRLQKENTEKQLQVIQHRNLLYILIVLFISTSALGLILYRKRQHKLKFEAEMAIRESKLKTSQKVHDIVANGLYRIMTDIEYGNKVEKEQLLDKIESLYEHTRDISYEQIRSCPVEPIKTITNLLISFATLETKVVIVGNQPELWSQIKDGVREDLEIVLQELMINMKKHSGAKNVVLKFELNNRKLEIIYADDGVGLPANYRVGNGLNNTENRIKKLNGQIIFGEDGGNGLKIKVHIPIV